MRVPASLLSLATLAIAKESLVGRSLSANGGWSLSMPAGATCPGATYTCFSNQTGVSEIFDRTGVPGTFDRGQECCPSGTSPQLDCGTYVNIGQPYACCPLDNADCRGAVEEPSRKGDEKCANSGWALWQIPDGDFNTFCCLPGWYGYWDKSLGQDAVGQCQKSRDLPEDMTPAMQFNNGDGSVNSAGVQVSALPVATPAPAPTCDILHYGWSLQVKDAGGCTAGSDLCSYGGACCPTGLNCGTVIGPSEVPVCCPPDNPDCRGDVEGLWPQVCADSSWALWHVNTNGNHFCCMPGQIGYNVPNDNAAVGFCGSAVPNGTMRSILDYNGDGSTPGSHASFPCDSNPAPNATWHNITSSILHPAATLNPTGLPLAVGIWGGNSTSWPSNPATKTIVKPWDVTTYVCPAGSSQTVAIIHSLSSGIPVTVTSTVGAPGFTATPSIVKVIYTQTVSGVAVTKTSTKSSDLTVYPSTTTSCVTVTITSTTDVLTVTSTISSSVPSESSASSVSSVSVIVVQSTQVVVPVASSEANGASQGVGGTTSSVSATVTDKAHAVVPSASSSASSVSGAVSVSGGVSGTGAPKTPTSLPVFTGGASSVAGSLTAVAFGAFVAAVLMC